MTFDTLGIRGGVGCLLGPFVGITPCSAANAADADVLSPPMPVFVLSLSLMRPVALARIFHREVSASGILARSRGERLVDVLNARGPPFPQCGQSLNGGQMDGNDDDRLITD
jgi:hypothetical protein